MALGLHRWIQRRALLLETVERCRGNIVRVSHHALISRASTGSGSERRVARPLRQGGMQLGGALAQGADEREIAAVDVCGSARRQHAVSMLLEKLLDVFSV